MTKPTFCDLLLDEVGPYSAKTIFQSVCSDPMPEARRCDDTEAIRALQGSTSSHFLFDYIAVDSAASRGSRTITSGQPFRAAIPPQIRCCHHVLIRILNTAVKTILPRPFPNESLLAVPFIPPSSTRKHSLPKMIQRCKAFFCHKLVNYFFIITTLLVTKLRLV